MERHERSRVAGCDRAQISRMGSVENHGNRQNTGHRLGVLGAGSAATVVPDRNPAAGGTPTQDGERSEFTVTRDPQRLGGQWGRCL